MYKEKIDSIELKKKFLNYRGLDTSNLTPDEIESGIERAYLQLTTREREIVDMRYGIRDNMIYTL